MNYVYNPKASVPLTILRFSLVQLIVVLHLLLHVAQLLFEAAAPLALAGQLVGGVLQLLFARLVRLLPVGISVDIHLCARKLSVLFVG